MAHAQFSTHDFKKFADHYEFTYTTSSPRYPQCNGEAERAMLTVKGLQKNTDDPYLALMSYRSTPLSSGYSPAEQLMGRRIRTTIPKVREQLQPSWPDSASLRQREEKRRDHQKSTFTSSSPEPLSRRGRGFAFRQPN